MLYSVFHAKSIKPLYVLYLEHVINHISQFQVLNSQVWRVSSFLLFSAALISLVVHNVNWTQNIIKVSLQILLRTQ